VLLLAQGRCQLLRTTFAQEQVQLDPVAGEIQDRVQLRAPPISAQGAAPGIAATRRPGTTRR